MKHLEKLIEEFYSQQLKKLKKGKIAGYFCLYVPPEIIEACGLIPVRLAGSSSSDIAEDNGEKFIHIEGCSFCRESLGSKNLKLAPHNNIDCLIVPSTCDQMKRHSELWTLNFGVPVYNIFVPSTWNDISTLKIYEKELEWLIEKLCLISKKKFVPDYLKDISFLYNDARSRLFRISKVLNHKTFFCLIHLFFISDIKSFEKYLLAIEKKINFNRESKNIKKKLMLVGSPVGYGDTIIDDILSKYNDADIVYDATCTGQRCLDTNISISKDMIHNAATAYFYRPPCIWRRPNSQFYDYIGNLIKEFDVDGVIYKTLEFCDVWKIEAKRFRDYFKIPVLELDTNYSKSQSAQIKNRVETFIDML